METERKQSRKEPVLFLRSLLPHTLTISKTIHTKCLRLLSQTQTCSQAHTNTCRLSLLPAHTVKYTHTHLEYWSCTQLLGRRRRKCWDTLEKEIWINILNVLYIWLTSHGMFPFLLLSFPSFPSSNRQLFTSPARLSPFLFTSLLHQWQCHFISVSVMLLNSRPSWAVTLGSPCHHHIQTDTC